MSEAKRQHCFNCGADLGVFVAYRGDILTCGSRECDRAASDQAAYEHDEARERAGADDYERYR